MGNFSTVALPRARTLRQRCGIAALGLLAWCIGVDARTAAACAPHIEEHSSGGTAVFRPHTDAFTRCPVAEATYRRVIEQWLRQRPAGREALVSVGLGRAVDYPWLSEYLARAALSHPAWDAKTGRSRGPGINRLAAEILTQPVLVARLQQPFAGSGYAVASVSVEKVLVGRLNEVLPGADEGALRVPYDAQVWLRLDHGR